MVGTCANSRKLSSSPDLDPLHPLIDAPFLLNSLNLRIHLGPTLWLGSNVFFTFSSLHFDGSSWQNRCRESLVSLKPMLS